MRKNEFVLLVNPAQKAGITKVIHSLLESGCDNIPCPGYFELFFK